MDITHIKKDDIIMLRVGIGKMPGHRIRDYLEDVKNSYKYYFNNEIIVIAEKNEYYHKFDIIRREELPDREKLREELLKKQQSSNQPSIQVQPITLEG